MIPHVNSELFSLSQAHYKMKKTYLSNSLLCSKLVIFHILFNNVGFLLLHF